MLPKQCTDRFTWGNLLFLRTSYENYDVYAQSGPSLPAHTLFVWIPSTTLPSACLYQKLRLWMEEWRQTETPDSQWWRQVISVQCQCCTLQLRNAGSGWEGWTFCRQGSEQGDLWRRRLRVWQGWWGDEGAQEWISVWSTELKSLALLIVQLSGLWSEEGPCWVEGGFGTGYECQSLYEDIRGSSTAGGAGKQKSLCHLKRCLPPINTKILDHQCVTEFYFYFLTD